MPRSTRRRWFRFSTRTLLAIVVLLAIPLAWVARERNRSGRQHRAAEKLQAFGNIGVIFDDWQQKQDRLRSGPSGYGSTGSAESRWREFARRLLGNRAIEVRGSRLDGSDLTPLAELTELKTLYLHRHLGTTLAPLANLTRLESIYVRAMPVRDLSPLARLINLNDLDLGGTQVYDVRPLARLHDLRTLSLADTIVEDVRPLAGLTNLESLNLEHTCVSDLRPLAKLKNLQRLYLHGTQITDLAPLVGLTNLKSLGVDNTAITQDQINELMRALPSCTTCYDMSP